MTSQMRLLLTAVLMLGACPSGAISQIACDSAHPPKQVAELLFGRNADDRVAVSEAAFRRFVAREIVPRFPGGLTVLDAAGQWRDQARGRLIREPSKVVQIVLFGGADDVAKLDAIAAAYKRQFRQKSVGIMTWSACVQF